MEIIFARPLMLLFLFLIPILIMLHYYFYQHNKKKAMKFSNFSAMRRVTGTKLLTKNTSQLILRLITFAMLIFMASGPKIMYEKELLVNSYVFAIDVSASMSSQDILPSRLELAKSITDGLIDKIDGRMAIMSFSGVSYIRQPLTDDKENLKLSIVGLDVDPSSGTDIGSALITSINLLPDGAKSIILLSDGSDTAGIYVDENLQHALSYVRKNNAIVNTIAIGTGKTEAGYVDLPSVYDFSTLKKISEDTNGEYFEVKSQEDIEKVYGLTEGEKISVQVPYDFSVILFYVAMFLLLFEWLLLNTRFRAYP